MAKEEPRKYVDKTSNIADYVDKVITIKSVAITGDDQMPVTELTLDNDEVISTTSSVIAKQAQEQKDAGLPVTTKIISVKGKGNLGNYYKFTAPE